MQQLSLISTRRISQFLFLISQRIRKKVEKGSTFSMRNISQHLKTSQSKRKFACFVKKQSWDIRHACSSENGRLKVEFWGKSIYNFAANSQSRGNQKTISKGIRSEFDAKFASLKSALFRKK